MIATARQQAPRQTTEATDKVQRVTPHHQSGISLPQFSNEAEPASDEKWAPWKTTLFVVTVCGGFWASLAYLIIAL